MKTLTLNSRLLAIIGRRLPAIYDAVIPRYYSPLPEPWNARMAAVALNPQPLPPGPPPDLLGAAIAAEFVHLARLADLFGHDQTRILAQLDDICPTYPKLPKFPGGWPHIPEPVPHPNWFIDFYLGFAARLAAISHEGTRIGDTIEKAMERSMGAIESASVAKPA